MAIFDIPDTPGREGSREACAILLLLHRHPNGLHPAEVAVLINASREAVDYALWGLKNRHRIVCTGRSTATRWMLKQHAPQAEAGSPTP